MIESKVCRSVVATLSQRCCLPSFRPPFRTLRYHAHRGDQVVVVLVIGLSDHSIGAS